MPLHLQMSIILRLPGSPLHILLWILGCLSLYSNTAMRVRSSCASLWSLFISSMLAQLHIAQLYTSRCYLFGWNIIDHLSNSRLWSITITIRAAMRDADHISRILPIWDSGYSVKPSVPDCKVDVQHIRYSEMYSSRFSLGSNIC